MHVRFEDAADGTVLVNIQPKAAALHKAPRVGGSKGKQGLSASWAAQPAAVSATPATASAAAAAASPAAALMPLAPNRLVALSQLGRAQVHSPSAAVATALPQVQPQQKQHPKQQRHASYEELADADWDGVSAGDSVAFRVMELVVGFKESTRPRGGVAIAFEPCVTGWKEATVLRKAADATRQLTLKVTGGHDQFAGYEAWQMDMVEADAPDEATRWRVPSEVEASWNELQSPKFISRAPQAAAAPPASKAAAAQPPTAPAAANRGARRAAARNQPAAAAAAVAAASDAAPVAAAAPLVLSFGVGLPPRPKRCPTK
jgi:hypothetical protein